MSESHERHSAQILPFPTRPRPSARLSERETMSAEVVLTPFLARGDAPLAQTACGSGWYHDEAIKEDEQNRKH